MYAITAVATTAATGNILFSLSAAPMTNKTPQIVKSHPPQYVSLLPVRFRRDGPWSSYSEEPILRYLRHVVAENDEHEPDGDTNVVHMSPPARAYSIATK